MEDICECPKCGGKVRQDEDVLDTWFSSQLWPFATQGWGQYGANAPELEAHYPTQVLSTARDIMGLWVARMVMASEYCTGQIPFKHVIIHPTVMGADGKPMSKSRGNGVNPMDLMATYGADAMRFGLLTQVTGAQAMRFDYQKIESARNFANKIRNASRFVFMNLEGYTAGNPMAENIADKWILSRLAKLIENVDAAYDAFDFSEMTRLLYGFFWNEFCDWYIEFSKGRLSSDNSAEDKAACQRNLVFVLEAALRMLHPVMPFITEEIYAELPESARTSDTLIVAPWPKAADFSKFVDEKSERAVSLVCEIVGAVRSARARYGISPKVELPVLVKANAADSLLLESQQLLISSLAKTASLEISDSIEKPRESSLYAGSDIEVYTILSGFVDFGAEKARLEKELKKAQADAQKFEKKLSNPGFLAKAAPEIIEKDKAKLAELVSVVEKLQERLAELA
jgi:valyl-tRNA synthetase